MSKSVREQVEHFISRHAGSFKSSEVHRRVKCDSEHADSYVSQELSRLVRKGVLLREKDPAFLRGYIYTKAAAPKYRKTWRDVKALADAQGGAAVEQKTVSHDPVTRKWVFVAPDNSDIAKAWNVASIQFGPSHLEFETYWRERGPFSDPLSRCAPKPSEVTAYQDAIKAVALEAWHSGVAHAIKTLDEAAKTRETADGSK